MEFTITVTGTRPLLMHNARLSDPLDFYAKAMSKINNKRKKTEQDYEELARLEFLGGIYHDAEFGPYLPGDNFQRFLFDSATRRKLGQAVKRGVFISSEVNPLVYDGPRDLESLWADENFRHRQSAKVQARRVIRTRPMFRQWTAQAEGVLDGEELDFDDLRSLAERGGSITGFGDWRPRFGQCVVTVEKA